MQTPARLLGMIPAGCCIQFANDVEVLPVGGIHTRNGSFTVSPPFPDSQSSIRTVVFDEVQDNGRSILFLLEGVVVAGVAPYMDFNEIDFNEFVQVMADWKVQLNDADSLKEFQEFLQTG